MLDIFRDLEKEVPQNVIDIVHQNNKSIGDDIRDMTTYPLDTYQVPVPALEKIYNSLAAEAKKITPLTNKAILDKFSLLIKKAIVLFRNWSKVIETLI